MRAAARLPWSLAPALVASVGLLLPGLAAEALPLVMTPDPVVTELMGPTFGGMWTIELLPADTGDASIDLLWTPGNPDSLTLQHWWIDHLSGGQVRAVGPTALTTTSSCFSGISDGGDAWLILDSAGCASAGDTWTVTYPAPAIGEVWTLYSAADGTLKHQLTFTAAPEPAASVLLLSAALAALAKHARYRRSAGS